MLATDTLLSPPLLRGVGGGRSIVSRKEIGTTTLELIY